MIKKILLTLGIIGTILFGYSFAIFPDPLFTGKVPNSYAYSVYEFDIPAYIGYSTRGGRQGYIENTFDDGILNFENNQILTKLNSNTDRYFSFGWVNGELYGISQYSNSRIYFQGFLKVCQSTYSNTGYFDNCFLGYNNNTNNYTGYDNLDLSITFDKIIYMPYDFSYGSIYERGNFCFISTINDYSLCIYYDIQNSNFGYLELSSLISQAKLGTGQLYDIFDNSSPFIGGGGSISGDGLVDLSYEYTNQEVFDAYSEAGYYRSMCFSDFSLSDLTESSGGFFQFEPDLVDGVYYTGSTIIDLYNSYSGSRSFDNFFNHWYNLYKYSLTVNSFNSFVGYSKGLWRIGYKYYMAGLGSSSLNYNNYYNYCNCFARMDLSVYGSDIYNCGSVPLEVENNFDKGNDYSDGVLGNLSGDSVQTPDEFFDTLTNSFNSLLNSDYGDYSGIIPVYILIALMGLIFIRMISH